MTDEATLDWYEREASRYAGLVAQGSARSLATGFLLPFLARLEPGAKVLDLGCGGGRDSLIMLQQGFAVEAVDGSPAMAREAQLATGLPVGVLRFTDLAQIAAFDAVWAHASIHHQPFAQLGDVLARIRRAVRPGGLFFANFKLGTGDERDEFGRLYSFPARDALLDLYRETGWSMLEIHDYRAGGADKTQRDWIAITAQDPA